MKYLKNFVTQIFFALFMSVFAVFVFALCIFVILVKSVYNAFTGKGPDFSEITDRINKATESIKPLKV